MRRLSNKGEVRTATLARAFPVTRAPSIPRLDRAPIGASTLMSPEFVRACVGSPSPIRASGIVGSGQPSAVGKGCSSTGSASAGS